MSNFRLNFTQRWKFSTLRGMEELNYLDWEGREDVKNQRDRKEDTLNEGTQTRRDPGRISE